MMKKSLLTVLLGTLLCGSALAETISFSNVPFGNVNGQSYGGVTFNYGFYSFDGGGPVVSIENPSARASLSFDTGSVNLHSLNLHFTGWDTGGSGSIGYDFSPYPIQMEFRDLRGATLGVREITLTAGGGFKNYDLSFNNVHEIIFSEPAGRWSPRLGGLEVSAVPEPETYGMLLGGLGILGFMAHRKRAAGKTI